MTTGIVATTKAGELVVTTLSTAALTKMGAPYNPRRISSITLKRLARSMAEFGVVEPIVVNVRSGHIVGGHQRVKAAAHAKIDALPVVHVDLDETAERQLNLALNQISGEWDEPALAALLAEIAASGGDIDLAGFDEEAQKQIEDDVRRDSSNQMGDLEYSVIIRARDEHEQRHLLERFTAEGLACRALIS